MGLSIAAGVLSSDDDSDIAGGKGKKGEESEKDSDEDTGSDSDASDYDSDADGGSEDEDNREFVQKDVEQRDFQVCVLLLSCWSYLHKTKLLWQRFDSVVFIYVDKSQLAPRPGRTPVRLHRRLVTKRICFS